MLYGVRCSPAHRPTGIISYIEKLSKDGLRPVAVERLLQARHLLRMRLSIFLNASSLCELSW